MRGTTPTMSESSIDLRDDAPDAADDVVVARPTPSPVVAGPLAGRLAVVTGGSGRVGRVVALRLADAGARVCVIGRDLVRLRATTELAGRDAPMLYLQCDLGSANEVVGLGDFVERFDRPIDLLVHAAGVSVPGTVADGDVADLDEQYLVNARGAFLVTQTFLPQLRQGGGHVVFVAPEPDDPSASTLQAMAAAATRALATGLARDEAEHQVRVSTVSCGTSATPLPPDALGDAVVDAASLLARHPQLGSLDLRLG